MRVSVVIPLYNKVKYIRRALDSVFAQTFADYEVIVIDDGSTDGSGAVVGQYRDPRLRYLAQANAGEGAARDRGIREAAGDYIAFLDADDEWATDHLASAVKLLDDFPTAALGAMRIALIDSDGAITPAQVSTVEHDGWRGVLSDYFAAALADPPFSSSTAIVRRSALFAFPFAYSPARIGADQYLWCQLALRYPVCYDHRVTAYYHRAAEGRALNVFPNLDELPFIPLLREVLVGGESPAHLNRESLLEYCAKYQIETLWRAVHSATPNRALMRRILRLGPFTARYRRDCVKYRIAAYSPTVVVRLISAMWRGLKSLTHSPGSVTR